MSYLCQRFIAAVQAAIDAPSKDGAKWNDLEKLFSECGFRGNGAINNGGGADRTTRVRQLATSKKHNGQVLRDVAQHSVFVIGGGSVAAYKSDPILYIKKVVQSLKDEHPNCDSCLILLAESDSPVLPIHLVRRPNTQLPVPYEDCWPGLQVTDLSVITATQGIAEAATSLYSDDTGENIIFFGPPGTGKSTEVKKRVGTASVFRVQFHPEYGHADFFGSYRPVVGSETDRDNMVFGHDGVAIARPVNYFAFVPGPLILALECAFTTNQNVYLVIEEVNRGDCASIFGDTFQLLDRDDEGRSEFGITPKQELLIYFNSRSVCYDIAGNGKLHLPGNLFLLATMNTSDQSLYPMDSAFKRRWQWVACPIEFDQLLVYTGGLRPFLDDGKTKWDWIRMIEMININIVRDRMEDRQLGPWFVKPAKDGLIPWDAFLNKCLFYLWHDVFKDEQFSDLSPFRADGPEFFGEVQANFRDNGLAAGFKNQILAPIPVDTVQIALSGQPELEPPQDLG